MRFPRLRLPARGSATPGLFTRARLRSYLIGAGLLLISLVAGIYLFFPVGALEERLEQEVSQGGVSVSIDQLALLFPPGLRAQEVTVRLPQSNGQSIDFGRPALRPLWGSLFGADPGVTFQTQLRGGEVSGWARKEGSIDAQAQGIVFAERLMPGSALELAGTLSQGSFTGTLPPAAGNDSRLEVTLDQVRLNGAQGLGAAEESLALGQVVLRGEGKGNTLRIEELSAQGGQLQVSGSGSLLLGKPVERSRLNLNLVLTPAAGFDPNLRDLLELFATPGGNGSYRLRLTGTLASPVFAK